MSLARRWTWEFEATPKRLWTYLADTDWVNEHAGLPRIRARYEPLPGGGTRRFASFRVGPLNVEWEERPVVWLAPAFYEIERIYRSGPLARFFTRTTLEPIAGADAGAARTRVIVDVVLEAAAAIARPLLPAIAARGKFGADRAYRLAARLARSQRPAGEGPRASGTRPRAESGPFAPLLAAGSDPDIVAALSAFVDAAEDRDLQRIRPYELADRWNLPRREVLRTLLAATRLGLLNLSWTVLCPGCRGSTPRAESLARIHRGYHCEACNLPFDAVFDRSVEVTFDARPIGRDAEPGLYCIASPQRSAHVHAQSVVAPNGSCEFALILPQGSYHINAVSAGIAPFVSSNDETQHALTATIDPLRGIQAEHSVASGAVRIAVSSALARETIVRIEDGRWPDTIATAAQVTALQEFRDLFSSEVLAPGLELSIETLAVLFTDLIGSTALYSRTGDAPAFRIVSDHFDLVREVVALYEGAIVKTIGDAVMAVFVDPLKCLEAALALDGSIGTIAPGGEPLRVRVGFHAGPCIAMRANERIDYFGTTVNLASRLQSIAQAGEVTMARSVAERPAIARRLLGLRTTVANETLEIKGFAQRVEVVRVSWRS